MKDVVPPFYAHGHLAHVAPKGRWKEHINEYTKSCSNHS